MGRRRKSDHEDDGSQSSARSTGDGDEQEAVSTNEGPQEEEEDVGVDELAKGLGGVSLGPKLSVDQITAPKELRQVADMIKSGKFNKILILTGAGVSVSAGIPDFRTPGTGLYDNLQKYNLPFAEAVFDIGFYRKNPEPFVQLAGQLWPGIAHSPTLTHSFISLLERKKMLLRNYTQNIDCLDVIAGVSEDKMVECHGHFRTASCISCNSPFDGNECKRIIVEERQAPKCRSCGGRVKPDIVFFGEQLPPLYHRRVRQDTRNADLLIVMGTSLLVGPVNGIPEMMKRDCPRILINRERVGNFGKRKRDVFHAGDCDDTVSLLCRLLGWEEELIELNESTRVKEEKKSGFSL